MSGEVRFRWKSKELGRLVAAVRADDVAAAAQALADGADPNISGLGLLRRVAANGSAAMAEVLLAHGTERDRPDTDGWTALTVADSWDNHRVAEVLEAAGADPSQRTIHGFTELHRSVRRGDLDAIDRAILDVGVNAVDAAGDTALIEAIERGNNDAVERLVAAGVDPNVQQPSWSPLTSAVYHDTVHGQLTEYTQTLLDAGADPNPSGVPPIVKTVNQAGERRELIDLLLAAGADINASDPRSGATLLHEVASLYDDPALVTKVLAAGALVDARDDRGRTPLHCAADVAHADVAAALLDAGADRDAVDEDGHRPVDLLGTDRFISPDDIAATRVVLTGH